MTLEELIARLKSAKGPDRELDARIAESIGWTWFHDHDATPRGDRDEGKIWVTWKDSNGVRHNCPDNYTSSIDAALTLVPTGGRLLELGQWQSNGQNAGWFCQVAKWIRDGEDSWREQGFAYGVPEIGAATVPPLAANGAIALCIAALKARATPNPSL